MMTESALKESIAQANSNRDNGRAQDAIAMYLHILEELDADNQRNYVAKVQEEIGVSYMIIRQSDSARQWYSRAIEVYKESNDQIGLGNAQRDMGLTYVYDKQYSDAEKWLHKSITTLSNTHNLNGLGISQVKLGVVMTNRGEFEEAEKKIISGRELILSDEHRSWFMDMTALLELARLYIEMGRYQDAIDQARSGIGIILEEDQMSNQQRRIGELFATITKGYLNLDQPRQALKVFVVAMTVWENMDAGSTQTVIELEHIEKVLDQFREKDPELAVVAEEAYDSIL